MKALRAPCRIIAENAGVEGEVRLEISTSFPSSLVPRRRYTVLCPQVIVQRLLGQSFEIGYNAMTDVVQNLLEAGVIDPAKVTKNGLLNSCSIAGTMLTTQAVMVEKQKGNASIGFGAQGMPSGMTV